MSGAGKAVFVYLHGFASGPGSTKARDLGARFEKVGVRLEVPDLNEGESGFHGLTITRAIAATRAAMERARAGGGLPANGPCVLVGSSFGGYVAALVAARDPSVSAIVLLAPAFGFAARLSSTLGAADLMKVASGSGDFEVYHYALRRSARVGYALITDGLRHEPFPDVRAPALIFHGVRDESVPIGFSEEFAKGRPNVRLVRLDDDHMLHASVGRIFEEMTGALGAWLPAR